MRQSYKNIFLTLWSVLLILGACDIDSHQPPLVTLTGFTMVTTYTIKINEPQLIIDIPKIKNDIDSILTVINDQMSTYQDDSELSRINQARTNDWITISDDLFTVISHAINISDLSNGAFDITVGPVVNLWGFGPDPRPEQVPEEQLIQSALDNVGYQYIHLRESPPALKKDRGEIYIDLSGIVPGFAVDKIAAYLEQHTIQNYMVELGGEIKAKGVNPDRKPWQIGIEKPVTNQRSVQRIINLDNIGLGTSGDYRNYFVQDGIHYSHIIDPKTGKPTTHRLASVTVLHSSTMIADALAVALFVMGPVSGIQFAQKENLAVIFIIRDKEGFTEEMTDIFKKYIHQ